MLVVTLLAGCGRFGFDPGSGTTADAAVDSALDAPAAIIPAVCDPRATTSAPISVGEAVTSVRAVPLSTGHALAIATDGGRIHVVPAAADGTLGTFHLPFDGGYTLFGLAQLADTPFVYVDTGGTGYIKILDAAWDSYATGPSADPVSIDPPQAALPGGQTAMFGLIFGAGMVIEELDDAGVSTGVTADYAPTATGGTFASTPSGVRVVVETGTGVCETFVVAADGTTRDRHTFGPCTAPAVAVLDDVHAAIVHQTSPGSSAVYFLPDDPLATGVTLPLGAIASPRVATIDGAAWIAYRDLSGAVQLARATPAGLTIEPAPAVTGEFDLSPTAVFWLDGFDVHVGEPCVR